MNRVLIALLLSAGTVGSAYPSGVAEFEEIHDMNARTVEMSERTALGFVAPVVGCSVSVISTGVSSCWRSSSFPTGEALSS